MNLPGPSTVLEDSDDEMLDEGEEDYREDNDSNTSRSARRGPDKKTTKGGPFKKSRKTVEEVSIQPYFYLCD